MVQPCSRACHRRQAYHFFSRPVQCDLREPLALRHAQAPADSKIMSMLVLVGEANHIAVDLAAAALLNEGMALVKEGLCSLDSGSQPKE